MAGAWTYERKKRLAEAVQLLNPEDLTGLVGLLVNALAITNQSEEIELDLDALPDQVLRQVEQYVLDSTRQAPDVLPTD